MRKAILALSWAFWIANVAPLTWTNITSHMHVQSHIHTHTICAQLPNNYRLSSRRKPRLPTTQTGLLLRSFVWLVIDLALCWTCNVAVFAINLICARCVWCGLTFPELFHRAIWSHFSPYIYEYVAPYSDHYNGISLSIITVRAMGIRATSTPKANAVSIILWRWYLVDACVDQISCCPSI